MYYCFYVEPNMGRPFHVVHVFIHPPFKATGDWACYKKKFICHQSISPEIMELLNDRSINERLYMHIFESSIKFTSADNGCTYLTGQIIEEITY